MTAKSNFFNVDLLDLQLVEHIKANPGVSLSVLADNLDAPFSTVWGRTRALERTGILSLQKQGRAVSCRYIE